jgi:hypothetical protein
LLDWLADDFARGGFDVKRLLRTIANSRAYQLEARPAGKTRPPDDTFACALDKPLSAEVFARSLLIATGHPPGTNGTFAPFELGELQKSFADVYPDVFPTENVSTVRQALFLSNNRALESVFQSSSTNALASVAALEEREQVRHLFVRVLGREPARDEMKRALDFLRSRSHEPAAAARHLLWALVTGAEFRLRP